MYIYLCVWVLMKQELKTKCVKFKLNYQYYNININPLVNINYIDMLEVQYVTESERIKGLMF